ncbi:MAG TPA: hypothetical protein VGL82_10440 [Bryobacteraceae bacterium]
MQGPRTVAALVEPVGAAKSDSLAKFRKFNLDILALMVDSDCDNICDLINTNCLFDFSEAETDQRPGTSTVELFHVAAK